MADPCDESDGDTVATQIAAHELGLAGLAVQGMDILLTKDVPHVRLDDEDHDENEGADDDKRESGDIEFSGYKHEKISESGRMN